MDLGNLNPTKGTKIRRKRIGRGNASGQGRTAGKGNNGAHSRSGYKSRIHHEGGQTPLMRRLPKRGFSNYPFKKEVQIVNIERIANLKLESVNVNTLIENGIIKKADQVVKILGNGNIDFAVEVTADMFSSSAIDKIEKAGGKAIFS